MPSTRAVPPFASVSMPSAVAGLRPRTSTAPAKVLRPLVAVRLTAPPSAPVALSCTPASTTILPCCAVMLTVPPLPVTTVGVGVVNDGIALALTTAPFSTVTSPASLLISTCPPLLPSASVWLPAPTVRSPLALRTILPPSAVSVVARMSPLCFKVPANTPTAPPLILPSTCALFAGACTSNFMSLRLRLPISIFSPAASTTLPPSLLITPSLATVTFGAMM